MPRGNSHTRFEARMAGRAAKCTKGSFRVKLSRVKSAIARLRTPRFHQDWEEFDNTITRIKRWEQIWDNVENHNHDTHFYENRECRAVSARCGSGDGHVIRKTMTHDRMY